MKLITTALFTLAASTAFADESFSFYIGSQQVSDSVASVVDLSGRQYDIDMSWEGKSFEMPIFYGFRYTNWQWGNIGWGVDFNHNKAYPTDEALKASGFKVMEFTDGINILTADLFYRFQNRSAFTPYLGVGLGVSLPHVELQSPEMSEKIFEYRLAGLAASAFLGVNYKVTKEWTIFAEGKFDYTRFKTDMGSGSYETALSTQAFNLGLSYTW